MKISIGRIHLILLLWLATYSHVYAITLRTITVVAGSGSLFDSYPNSTAMPALPVTFQAVGIAIDSASGDLYLSDSAAGFVYIVLASTSEIKVFAGNGDDEFPRLAVDGLEATNAILYYPEYLAVDSNSQLYITELTTNRVRLVNNAGEIYTIAGDATNEESGYSGSGVPALTLLNYLRGIFVDSVQFLYICDYGFQLIRQVDLVSDGTSVLSGAFTLATSSLVNGPLGLWVSSTGDIYFSNEGSGIFSVVYRATNTIVHVFAGEAYTVDNEYHENNQASTAVIPIVVALTGDTLENLYMSGNTNQMAYVNPSGQLRLFAGDFGGIPGSYLFTDEASISGTVEGLIIDTVGSLYFVDTLGVRVKVVYNASMNPTLSSTYMPSFPTSQPSSIPTRQPTRQPSSYPKNAAFEKTKRTGIKLANVSTKFQTQRSAFKLPEHATKC